MKLYSNNGFNIEIDVYLPAKYAKLVATDIIDIPEDIEQADPLALENYYAFRESVEEIFDYYDFECMKYRLSDPSKYYYYAHERQLKNEDVPRYVRVRVSAHPAQHKSKKHEEEIRRRTESDLEELKLPKNKIIQRYLPIYITVNSESEFDTYEEVLNYVEHTVRSLFDKLHISELLDKYGPPLEF
ncbi:MAG: hypothetical protein Q4A48_04425 [Bacillota bacterium]|nr:hypothetical protein [Bacillota bacterium]